MATGPLSGYAGDVKLTSGINPSGGKDIPLVDAHYIAADQKIVNGETVIIRLDEKLEEMTTKSYVDGLFGSYINDIDTLIGGES